MTTPRKRRAKHSSKRHSVLVPVTLRGDCKPAKKRRKGRDGGRYKAHKDCPTIKGLAFVDTGAAHSFIDPSVAKKLGLKRVGRGPIKGVVGKPQMHDKYAVTMDVPGLRELRFERTGAYANDQKTRFGGERGRIAALGRDAMAGGDDPKAGFWVVYDGPGRQVSLHPAVPKHVLRAVDEERVTRRR